jgi:hypothetical protein
MDERTYVTEVRIEREVAQEGKGVGMQMERGKTDSVARFWRN